MPIWNLCASVQPSLGIFLEWVRASTQCAANVHMSYLVKACLVSCPYDAEVVLFSLQMNLLMVLALQA